jgi:hypothetical protein
LRRCARGDKGTRTQGHEDSNSRHAAATEALACRACGAPLQTVRRGTCTQKCPSAEGGVGAQGGIITCASEPRLRSLLLCLPPHRACGHILRSSRRSSRSTRRGASRREHSSEQQANLERLEPSQLRQTAWGGGGSPPQGGCLGCQGRAPSRAPAARLWHLCKQWEVGEAVSSVVSGACRTQHAGARATACMHVRPRPDTSGVLCRSLLASSKAGRKRPHRACPHLCSRHPTTHRRGQARVWAAVRSLARRPVPPAHLQRQRPVGQPTPLLRRPRGGATGRLPQPPPPSVRRGC